jgi:hypothetical protein
MPPQPASQPQQLLLAGWFRGKPVPEDLDLNPASK